jgi:lipopolysaccharide/colanic/teichoic acid biosynthesis glycosyltransferase
LILMTAKRVLDILLSAAILCLISPIMAVVALAVLLESGRPVLFSQVRVGRNLRKFRILKFRTMRVQNGGPSVTVEGDRRITRVGAFLRRTKLDELPQFWNVIRGDMSIVGPRPEVPEYVDLFLARFEQILIVRPGITDLASIYYRDEEKLLADCENPLMEYRERVLPAKLDLAEKYILERSITGDLRIIFQSARAAFWPQTAAKPSNSARQDSSLAGKPSAGLPDAS